MSAGKQRRKQQTAAWTCSSSSSSVSGVRPCLLLTELKELEFCSAVKILGVKQQCCC
jgi:hypothetical protein